MKATILPFYRWRCINDAKTIITCRSVPTSQEILVGWLYGQGLARGAIWEGGGVEDVGARGVRLYLRRVSSTSSFTWGGLSVHLEQSSANIARTHAMVSTQSFIGNNCPVSFFIGIVSAFLDAINLDLPVTQVDQDFLSSLKRNVGIFKTYQDLKFMLINSGF